MHANSIASDTPKPPASIVKEPTTGRPGPRTPPKSATMSRFHTPSDVFDSLREDITPEQLGMTNFERFKTVSSSPASGNRRRRRKAIDWDFESFLDKMATLSNEPEVHSPSCLSKSDDGWETEPEADWELSPARVAHKENKENIPPT